MVQAEDRDATVRELLMSQRMATMGELKEAMGTRAAMTVHRSLCRLGYLAIYSVRRRF